MMKVKCSICGMDMDCPESMLSAQRHFCARCTDMLAEGYEPEDLKMDKESLERRFKRCDEVAEEMLDIAFYGYWNKVQAQGMEHYNYEALSKMFFLQGASSMLDDLMVAIRGAKKNFRESEFRE